MREKWVFKAATEFLNMNRKELSIILKRTSRKDLSNGITKSGARDDDMLEKRGNGNPALWKLSGICSLREAILPMY